MLARPQNKQDLQKREAIGVIRASRFVRKYSHTKKPITFEVVYDIHKEIFQDAWPEIAGKNRRENIKINDSKHLPSHYSKVPSQMNEAEK